MAHDFLMGTSEVEVKAELSDTMFHKLASFTPKEIVPGDSNQGRSRVISFNSVIAIVTAVHFAAIAYIITNKTEYKQLDIINPAEQVSVQATIVALPDESVIKPVPSSEAPVMTAENAERQVVELASKPAVTEHVQTPIKKVDTAPKPLPKPKPQPKLKPVAKPSRQPVKPVEVMKEKADDQIPAERTALPATTQGKTLTSVPQTTPRMVSSVGCIVPAPDYPRRAKRLKQEGEVLVRLVISADGRLSRDEIARSSGIPELDNAALAAVKGISCKPYMVNGQAVSVMTVQPVLFKLSK